jgi:hypothetical protein
MAENTKSSKILLWVVIALVVAGGLFWAVSMLFPEIISKFATMLVGLLVVVTGLFFRRKK